MAYKVYNKKMKENTSTPKYCVVDKDDINFYMGETIEEIVTQIFDWKLEGDGRNIVASMQGSKPRKYNGYIKHDPSDRNTMNDDEARKDAIKFLFLSLDKEYGFKVFVRRRDAKFS